ncbi:MAG: two-component sensor histidine kinase [Saprospiraceae bacterium]|nr:MAG: two-component sensor histidine kinase [Saprospiraceae bacterium]
MKLIYRTYTLTAIWLLPVMIIGSIFCFYMIEYIAYEETDEFLTYEMERLVNYHKEFKHLPEYHKVADILPDVKYDHFYFKDTLLLEPGDNELVPYRELRFTIDHKGRDFSIVLRHLLLGRDDVAQGTLLIIIGLMLLVALFLVIMVNQITGQIWKPFYHTLDNLKKFKIGEALPVFQKTEIEEFGTLNATLQTLLKKITSDYHHNKEFNENASHELQTHLAIIRANTEKLLNRSTGEVEAMGELKKIYAASTRLSQVQKSLLLLSKITNKEYSNNQDVKLQEPLNLALDFFSEAINIREIELKKHLEPCMVNMDAGLAEILVNNLLKNAVKHNLQKGYIWVKLTASSLIIENSGLPFQGDPNSLLERFAKGENGNIGIGLAIVKQICELYNFSISYEVSEQDSHKITILFATT